MYSSTQYRPHLQSPPPPSLAIRHSFQQITTSPSLKLISQPSQISRPLYQPPQINRSFQYKDNNNVTPQIHNNSAIRYTQQYTSTNLQRVDQPLQVVDLQQVEDPWRQKVAKLEAELSRIKNKNNNIADSDDDESELSQAYSQIQQLVNTIKSLQEEVQNAQEKVDYRDNIIETLERQAESKDKEIDELNNYIHELNQQLEDSNIEEKQKYLFDEVNTWKKKFIDQNKEFHQKQEELMLLQAELDNLKNSQVILNKTSEYNKTSDYKNALNNQII